jgi:hypothetical protein
MDASPRAFVSAAIQNKEVAATFIDELQIAFVGVIGDRARMNALRKSIESKFASYQQGAMSNEQKELASRVVKKVSEIRVQVIDWGPVPNSFSGLR